jgi:hypothetical protein
MKCPRRGKRRHSTLKIFSIKYSKHRNRLKTIEKRINKILGRRRTNSIPVAATTTERPKSRERKLRRV